VIPLVVGTWLLWAPVRALIWGEGLEEPAYEVSSRKLARNGVYFQHEAKIRFQLRKRYFKPFPRQAGGQSSGSGCANGIDRSQDYARRRLETVAGA